MAEWDTRPNAAVASGVSASRLQAFPRVNAMPSDVIRLIETDRHANAWRIREFEPINIHNAAPISLICESGSTVRRLWAFPKDWRLLADADLLALFDIVLRVD
jgi:hypothetical protein